jgi:hypothetical protein
MSIDASKPSAPSATGTAPDASPSPDAAGSAMIRPPIGAPPPGGTDAGNGPAASWSDSEGRGSGAEDEGRGGGADAPSEGDVPRLGDGAAVGLEVSPGSGGSPMLALGSGVGRGIGDTVGSGTGETVGFGVGARVGVGASVGTGVGVTAGPRTRTTGGTLSSDSAPEQSSWSWEWEFHASEPVDQAVAVIVKST